MSLSITWNEGSNPPTTFTFSAGVIASLNSHRLTFLTQDPVTGTMVPMYPGLKEFAVAMFTQKAIVPAMDAFPVPEVATAKAAADAAQATLASVKAVAINDAVTAS